MRKPDVLLKLKHFPKRVGTSEWCLRIPSAGAEVASYRDGRIISMYKSPTELDQPLEVNLRIVAWVSTLSNYAVKYSKERFNALDGTLYLYYGAVSNL